MENQNQKDLVSGQIELTKMKGVKCSVMNGKKCIVIPFDENETCLSSYKPEPKDGVQQPTRVFLNIRVVETPNGKFGSHMITTYISKKDRERLGLNTSKALQDAQLILGNLTTLKAKTESHQQEEAPRNVQQDNGDMPDFENQSEIQEYEGW